MVYLGRTILVLAIEILMAPCTSHHRLTLAPDLDASNCRRPKTKRLAKQERYGTMENLDKGLDSHVNSNASIGINSNNFLIPITLDLQAHVFGSIFF